MDGGVLLRVPAGNRGARAGEQGVGCGLLCPMCAEAAYDHAESGINDHRCLKMLPNPRRHTHSSSSSFLIEKKNFCQIQRLLGEGSGGGRRKMTGRGKSLKLGNVSMGLREINCTPSYENNL